jgi:hypothetical protein
MSTMSFKDRIIGPRTPSEVSEGERKRYRLPTILLGAAAALILVSMLFPYWNMTLLAPQYPGGLHVQVYVNRMTGDVDEIDGLNHYIGMRPLAEAAELERSVSIAMIALVGLLVLSAIFVHSKWALLLALPAILMPFVFLADMYYWLRDFGLNLDPTAALSNSIEPFIPPIIGSGFVGQFETVASLAIGWYMAFLGSVLIVVGLYYQRKAYKPLVEGNQ